jgi:hypothetical protein
MSKLKIIRHSKQLELNLFSEKEPELYLERSYSGLLWDALDRKYQRTAPEAHS